MTQIGDPIPMQFLPAVESTFVKIDDADLDGAYELPNYPGKPEGLGRMAKLFDGETPVGVIWGTARSVGILPAPEMDTVEYTVAVLQLREYAARSVPPHDAFDYIVQAYDNGPVIETDMADVHTYLDELEVDTEQRPW